MKNQSLNFNALVAAIEEWLDPAGPYQQKILQDLSRNPVALKITMKRPAPDGDFAILFVKASESERKVRELIKDGEAVEILSFAEGMRLSQRPDCSGGPYEYNHGKKLIALNPSLQDQNGTNHLII